jgi:hypothetical protein
MNIWLSATIVEDNSSALSYRYSNSASLIPEIIHGKNVVFMPITN